MWHDIAESLRTEVAEYGALLHLFEEQQRFLFKRDAASVVATTNSLDQQVELLQKCRFQREHAVARFAEAHGQSTSATVRSLIHLFPSEVQPLISALIGDINRMISKVRRLSRQNRLFLSRTIDYQHEMIRKFRPEAATKTYSPAGRATFASISSGGGTLVAQG
jgi:flagellar biosynthesis/type III secretory pathway chaperone